MTRILTALATALTALFLVIPTSAMGQEPLDYAAEAQPTFRPEAATPSHVTAWDLQGAETMEVDEETEAGIGDEDLWERLEAVSR